MSNSHRNMPNPNQSPEIYHYNTLNAHRVLLRNSRSASYTDIRQSIGIYHYNRLHAHRVLPRAKLVAQATPTPANQSKFTTTIDCTPIEFCLVQNS